MKHIAVAQFQDYFWRDAHEGAIAEGGRGIRHLMLGGAAVLMTALAFLLPVKIGDEAPPEQSAMLAKAPHPLVGKYCMSCHDSVERTAGLAFDQMSLVHPERSGEQWEAAVRRLNSGMMPPAGSPRPTEAETMEMIQAITTRLDGAKPVPAPAVLSRLTRTEYGNVIRDLLGMRVDVASLLPPDPSVKGFDNIGEVLTTSPALVQGYLNAGMKISRLAVGDPTMMSSRRVFTVPHKLNNERYIEGLPLGTRGGIRTDVLFPVEGDYVLEVRLGPGSTLFQKFGQGKMPKVDLTVAGKAFAVDKEGKARVHVRAGTFPVTAALRDPDVGPGVDDIYATYNIRGAILDVAVNGPFNIKGVGNTASRAKIFSCYPGKPYEERTCARSIVARLASQAFRRPLAEQAPEMDLLMRYYDQGRQVGNFETGVQRAVAYLLVDPRFLYKTEFEPANAAPGGAYAISPVELASRLSFFLWSSIPDEQLMASAASGKLSEPAELEKQVRRMIADPRSDALVDNFAQQWFHLQQLDSAERDSKDFDDNLRFAMAQETKLLFKSVLRGDRPITELLSANYTYLNERLARHYGIAGIKGDYFRRVSLPADSPRRGLLGHASVLTVTSVANRTSPVIRGAWVLDNILGVPPSPPPPGVETNLDGAEKQPQTLRERLAMHRKSPACASCHNMMDPIGLSMENFDQVGKWRTLDGKFPIDASGKLLDGTPLRGAADLRNALLKRSDAFTANAASKLMTYALGRPVTFHEMPAVRQVLESASRQNNRFVSLLLGVVKSQPFLTRTKARSPVGPPARSTQADKPVNEKRNAA
jgi:mono/diheme cytochrome c family protein